MKLNAFQQKTQVVLVNCTTERQTFGTDGIPQDIYVGRNQPATDKDGNDSWARHLANPFKIDSERSRDQAVAQYAKMLKDALAGHNELVDSRTDAAKAMRQAFLILSSIYVRNRNEGKITYLGCHCAPDLCHAHVLAKALYQTTEELIAHGALEEPIKTTGKRRKRSLKKRTK